MSSMLRLFMKSTTNTIMILVLIWTQDNPFNLLGGGWQGMSQYVTCVLSKLIIFIVCDEASVSNEPSKS